MTEVKSHAIGGDFVHGLCCGEECDLTGKCQRREENKFNRLYVRLQEWKSSALGIRRPLLSSVYAELRGLFADLELYLNQHNMGDLSDLDKIYPGIELTIPYVRRNPRRGRWLLEVTYHAHRAAAGLGNLDCIPNYFLSRAMDIADVLTLEAR